MPTAIWRSARSFMSSARRQPTRSWSILCWFPCRIDASSIAASRLLAAPIAWMSPVKWRFRSSIGTTCVIPPPAAPPLMPNTGETDERRRLTLARLRRRHAGHAHELAVGPVGEPLDHGEVDLALVATVRLDLLRLEAAGLADHLDRDQLRFLGDLQAALHRIAPPGVSG